jgi:hypothetical protein
MLRFVVIGVEQGKPYATFEKECEHLNEAEKYHKKIDTEENRNGGVSYHIVDTEDMDFDKDLWNNSD